MMADFKAHNVNLLTLHKILSFNEGSVSVQVLDKDGNVVETKDIACDVVVNALASSKVKYNLEGVNVHYVGDCADGAPCNIDNATKSAYDVANKL